MSNPCRCGHNGPDPHPCHGNAYRCRKPAKQRFYGARNPTLYSGDDGKTQAAIDVAARFTARAWVPLSTLRPGVAFVTKEGDRCVKLAKGTKEQAFIVCLGNGEEARAPGDLLVREVAV